MNSIERQFQWPVAATANTSALSAGRPKQPRRYFGFVLPYRTGLELNYVHGALLLADDGWGLHTFWRKRMEQLRRAHSSPATLGCSV